MPRYLSGRPRIYADFGSSTEEDIEIIAKFWEIIASLSRKEKIAVARGLNRKPNTVLLQWTYHKRFPGIEIARKVIKWNEEGRPTYTLRRTEEYLTA